MTKNHCRGSMKRTIFARRKFFGRGVLGSSLSFDYPGNPGNSEIFFLCSRLSENFREFHRSFTRLVIEMATTQVKEGEYTTTIYGMVSFFV